MSFGDDWHKCGDHYDITFGCTRTVYTDEAGNSEGNTVFVSTECATNTPLDVNEDQDHRYLQVHRKEDPKFNLWTLLSPFNTGNGQFEPQVPFGDQTCLRGCLCGYVQPYQYLTTNNLYNFCGCPYTLWRFYVASPESNVPQRFNIPLSTDNMTDLQTYGFISCNAKAGMGSEGSFVNAPQGDWAPVTWFWIPDGDKRTIQKPVECFGNTRSIREVMNMYSDPGPHVDTCGQENITNSPYAG
ncbi:MAG: hypothetical protein L6R39_007090 [Caloplaca ligustica]|nr:MAG: hypothetical protein L6R39_007090 [Caloplaca ligustica]